QTQASQEYAEKLRIKFSNLSQLSSNLSGGNQQKVVIARWLMTNPRVLIADEPTRGIDVGTKREIADLFKRIADQGLGILLMSEEADEILDLSDRIIVMRDGRVECTFNRGEIQKSGLVECVTGLSRETSRRRREG
ncbi:MAG TPA: ATP-binding cassette domain-containing protein, partial [Spirochaetia bacterium]